MVKMIAPTTIISPSFLAPLNPRFPVRFVRPAAAVFALLHRLLGAGRGLAALAVLLVPGI